MKNRVQIKEETRRGGPEITLQEIISLAMKDCFFLDSTF
jgi:hypothetical protein